MLDSIRRACSDCSSSRIDLILLAAPIHFTSNGWALSGSRRRRAGPSPGLSRPCRTRASSDRPTSLSKGLAALERFAGSLCVGPSAILTFSPGTPFSTSSSRLCSVSDDSYRVAFVAPPRTFGLASCPVGRRRSHRDASRRRGVQLLPLRTARSRRCIVLCASAARGVVRYRSTAAHASRGRRALRRCESA